MKTLKMYHLMAWVGIFAFASALLSFTSPRAMQEHVTRSCAIKGCVFLTLMGEESSDSNPTQVRVLTNHGLQPTPPTSQTQSSS